MEYSVNQATEAINRMKYKVDFAHHPLFHFVPPVGWMNDPNGLIFDGGLYHIFYQFYPYDSSWGPMHWGHATSLDLLHFHDEEVALAPDRKDETGCFSGSSIANVDGHKLILIYTSHFEDGDESHRKERQVLAFSDDGIHFSKEKRIAIDISDIPEGYSRHDFRDPFLFRKDGYYYVFIGSKEEKNDIGALLAFRSKDLNEFTFAFALKDPHFGKMLECPSFLTVNGLDILVYSAVGLPKEGDRFQNCNSSLCLYGHLDFEKGIFEKRGEFEMDRGDAFYAPYLFLGKNGEPLIMAWMEQWGKLYPTAERKEGYAGALSLPRHLAVNDGKVYQEPYALLLKEALEPSFLKTGEEISSSSLLDLVADEDFSLDISDGLDHSISINRHGKRLDFITAKANNLNPLLRTIEIPDHLAMKLILDVSSLEVFIDKVPTTFSTRFYFASDRLLVSFSGSPLIKYHKVRI